MRSAVAQAELMTGYSELDGLSKQLLEWIARRVGQAEDLYVSEIIRHSEIASPATLSKLLAGLKDRGLLSITPKRSSLPAGWHHRVSNGVTEGALR
jgi:hypothetical protein